jgi:hypothetical protein
MISAPTFAAPPAANLDQIRNGSADAPNDPVEWVNGNSGESNAHYFEGYSISYRAILTDLPTDGTVITLILEYDIKHGGRHAIDYLTHYDRLDPANGPPHAAFGHPAEEVDPTDGYDGVDGIVDGSMPDNTYAIPAPSSAGSPIPGMPTDSFNALPASERVMSMWNGTISAVAYVTEGDLNIDNSSTSIAVTFTASAPTAILAWGGHIASREDWGFDADGNPRSAGGLSGSPYHMRLIDWNLNNLGNQDRSLKVAAVYIPPPECATDCPADIAVCEGDPAGCCAIGTEGEPPYTIEWRNSAGTLVQSCNGVADGGNCCLDLASAALSDTDVYSAKVIDSRGQESEQECSFSLTVNENPTCSVEDVCLGEELCVTPSGGTTPYTYLWSNGETTQCITPGTTGIYSVRVTDANGCSSESCQGEVFENPTCSVEDVCLGEELCVTPSGGTGPYTFMWDTGETSQCITPGAAGTHSVTVTDANGCMSQSCEGEVFENPTCLVEDVCLGEELCVTPSGGAGSYTFMWNTGETSQCITPDAAGIYSATVTDANGCSSEACEGEVFENPVCDIPVPDPLPFCRTTGNELMATVRGGTPPYVLDWALESNTGAWIITDGQGTDEIKYQTGTFLLDPQGTFTLDVTDANDCDTDCQAKFTCIDNPAGCAVEPILQDVCEGGTARFCAIPTSGIEPFDITWVDPAGNSIPPAAGSICTGLIRLDDTCCIEITDAQPDDAGTYSATVTDGGTPPDSSVCTGTLVVNESPTCNVYPPSAEECSGMIQEFCAMPSGGTAPYDVVWRNSAGDVIQTCLDIDAGGECCFTTDVGDTYTATITDAEGCVGTCDAVFSVLECACRVTGGGVDGTVPPHSWAEISNRGNHYTFGGQAGAPTSLQPQPWGEWTHRQHRGPDGRFTFHAGTASAPAGTEIAWIQCHDPDNCNPARPAPNKQIDFEGIGSFKNITGNTPIDQYVVKGESLHWFAVHIEDLGEPGNYDPDAVDCPAGGHVGLPPPANCDCPDFYTIRIHATEDPASDVIYEVGGYLNGGNLQIHPPIRE